MIRNHKPLRLSWILAAILQCAALPLHAGESCSDFKWDVSRERALFHATATAINGSTETKTAVRVEWGHLYEISLLPQKDLKLAAQTGKPSHDVDHVYGGLVLIRVEQAGRYRIALDTSAWVDVIVDGKILDSVDHTGSHDCNAPHKVVVFDLPSHGDLILQFTDAPQARLRAVLLPDANHY